MAHTDAELLLLPTHTTNDTTKVVYEMNAQKVHVFQKSLGVWVKQESRTLNTDNIAWAKALLEPEEP